MATSPFVPSPTLTAIAIAYRNPAYALIGEKVMPRANPVLGTKEFRYRVYNLADGYTVPDTAVGRTGRPAEVSTQAVEMPGMCEDHGLDYPLPQDDITQAKGSNTDPRGFATEFTANLVNLGREIRVAAKTFSANSYGAASVQTLSGTDQFNDAASDPVAIITEMLDTPLLRPNRLVFGKAVWGVLRRHPKLLKAIFPSGNGEGMATRQQVADLFEVGEVLVGESFVNANRKGQAANFQRVWGNHIAGHFIDPTANNQAGVTWGLTMQYGQKVAGTSVDGSIGARGGERVRVVDTVAELVVAPDAGFLIQNAISG